MKEAACRTDLGPLTKKLLEQQQVIERLTAERDEARRQFCTAIVSRPFGSGTIYNCGAAEEEATRRGWDCFKERTP